MAGGLPAQRHLAGARSFPALIEQRLSEIRKGLLTLNREDDARFFDKEVGMKPYALENSPLIPLFNTPFSFSGYRLPGSGRVQMNTSTISSAAA